MKSLALAVALTLTAVFCRADNPGVVEIDHPEAFGKVIALSDIHGMYSAMVPLLKSGGVIDASNKWAAGNALLIVVGDSIDKGDDSVDVLDLWISLSAQASAAGGRIIHLLGNHEAEFLADPTNHKAKVFLQELKAKKIAVTDYTDAAKPRGQFLRSEPVAARVGKWLFCHAGLIPDGTWAQFKSQASGVLGGGSYGDDFLIGDDSILEARKWTEDPALRAAGEKNLDDNGLYGVVFGHQPKALGVEGADAITDDGRIIKIDNGMPPDAGSHPGSLLIFSHPADLSAASAPTVVTVPSGGAARPLAHEAH